MKNLFIAKLLYGNFHIYKYDKIIDGYTLLDSSNSVYADIMRKLLKINE